MVKTVIKVSMTGLKLKKATANTIKSYKSYSLLEIYKRESMVVYIGFISLILT